MSTLVEACGDDIGDASLSSAQTIHRQRKVATTERAKDIREELKLYKGMRENGGYFVVLH